MNAEKTIIITVILGLVPLMIWLTDMYLKKRNSRVKIVTGELKDICVNGDNNASEIAIRFNVTDFNSYYYENYKVGYVYRFFIKNYSENDKILSRFTLNADNIQIKRIPNIVVMAETVNADLKIRVKNTGWGVAEMVEVEVFDDNGYLKNYYRPYELTKICRSVKPGDDIEILSLLGKPQIIDGNSSKKTKLFIRCRYDNCEYVYSDGLNIELYDDGFYRLGVGGAGPTCYESIIIDTSSKTNSQDFQMNYLINKNSVVECEMRVLADKSAVCNCELLFEFNQEEQLRIDIGKVDFDVPSDMISNHFNEKLTIEKVGIETGFVKGFPHTID